MNRSKTLDAGSLPMVLSFDAWKPVATNLGLITAGSLVFVIGMHSILIPQQFVTGGITGIAMILHYAVNSLDVGVVYFVLNVPLFVLGLFSISRRFMLYTIFGMTVFSVAAKILQMPALEIHDPLLAAVSAGVLCGIGGGLILRSVGSAGGFDILGIFLNQRFGVRPGAMVFVLNLFPLGLGLALYPLDIVLYSMIYAFIYAKVVDTVLTGFNQRKTMLIISQHVHEIAQHILVEEHRGVTFLKGEGAYTGESREVIFTITTLIELPKIKSMIFDVDPDAFVVVNDTLEVLGRRHGHLKIY
jgi:uncharacterized membrane-anchored protein YitT (DUF2179 family)